MRYTPFESMDRLFDQLRRDMMEWSEDYSEGTFGSFNMDLSETDDGYVFTADLPGFERGDIDLRFDDGILHVSATRDVSEESTSRRRSVGERVSIPGEIVIEEITASYHNGVLEVHLPLAEDVEPSGHEIDIE